MDTVVIGGSDILRKALMGGIPMVAAVGAPSSLAVQVAKEFNIALIGFLREDHFNIYHGSDRIDRLYVDISRSENEAAN